MGRLSGRGLTRQLMAMGLRASKGGPGHRLRSLALALATAFLCCTAGTVVITMAADSAKQNHAQARAPRFTGKFPGERAVAHWRESGDTVGGLQHSVIFIEPLTPGASPPPGLSAWPRPGQAVLSPALAAAGQREGISDRYGRDAGRISADGLTSPSERLVYVRPTAATSPEWDETMEISGFGDPDPTPFGDSIGVVDADAFMAAVLGFLGLPAAVLTVVALRCGSAARDRRTALLDALGGTWRHRALVCVGEALWPVGAGAFIGTVPLLTAAYTDIAVPLTGYTLSAAAVRAWLPAVLLGAAGAAAAVLVASVLLHRKKGDARSPRTPAMDRVKRRYALLCAFGLVLAMPVDLGPLAPDYRVSIVQYAIGIVLTLATLPTLIAWSMTALGRRLAGRSIAKRYPGGLIAGRWLQAYPGVVARLVVAVVVGLGLVSQVQLWVSRTTVAATEARQTFDALGDSVLIIRSRVQPASHIKAFQEETGRERAVFALLQDRREPPVLTGPCASWKAVHLPCPSARPTVLRDGDRRLSELGRWETGTPDLRIATGAIPTKGERDGIAEIKLVVISDPGDASAAGTVREAAYRHLGTAPLVNVLAGAQLGGALLDETIANWVTLLGLGGLLMAALAAAFSALAEFQVFGSRLAPVGVLAGDTHVFRSTALWYLSVPIGVAGCAGAVVSAVLGYPMVTTGGARWAPELTAVTVMGSAMLAICVGLAGGQGVVARARSWRPGAD
ncbi:hypothetical protein ABZ214_05710 [Streptomyces iakyrus]|uniref:hypothetical protein n=1 Tax=Streptomyces iakyrus TaxID=68219 RepID=UPI0033B8B3AF